MRVVWTTLLCAAVATAAACGGDDPVSYSEPVAIGLKVKSGDVKNGAVEDDKGITTEVSNPYGAFIKNARSVLGGVDPTRVSISSLSLTLGAKSKGVTKLEDVFNGTVELLFLVDETKNTHKAAHVDNPQGSGPVDLIPSFDWQNLASTDQINVVAGKFKLVARGPVVTGFDKAGAEAELQFTLRFEAFK